MTTATLTRMPADASDDLLRALHREESWNVRDSERITCPEHGDWRDRCLHQHVKAVAL